MKKYLLICIFLLSPLTAFAATLSLSVQPTAIGVGDVVAITLHVSSDISINTFSGTLTYSRAQFTPVAVEDGSSIISIWLTRPHIEQNTESIVFAGFTPGGYAGREGKILTVLLRASVPGTTRISLNNIELLRSDGAGTSEPVTSPPLIFSIGPKSVGSFTEQKDVDPPEPFVTYSSLSPAGQQYLIFSAVDKTSGIDHYEIVETRLPFVLSGASWTKTEAPYELLDQGLLSTVYVKAVDRAGNVRITVFHRQHLLRPYEWAVLCAMLILSSLLWRRRVFNRL